MEVSSLLQSKRLALLAQEKASLLLIEAVTSRSKSTTATKSIAKHIRGLLNYYIEIRSETHVSLTAEHSAILLRDYIESHSERSRTVPATERHALNVWADALGIDWPTNHSLVTADVTIEHNEDAKQAPSMSVATVRQIEELARSKEVCVCVQTSIRIGVTRDDVR